MESNSSSSSLLKNPLEWWQSRSPVWRFSISFLGIMLLFYLIYSLPFFENSFVPAFIRLQANLSSGFLNLLGYETTVNELSITGSRYSVSVAKGCDGVESMALLAGAILVFPLPFRLKWPGLLAGLGILFLLNILRIAGLYMAGIHWPSAFELLHTHGGFVLFTTFSVLLVIVWISWAIKKTRPADETP
jgi:exosortase/archaeosortase family protein